MFSGCDDVAEEILKRADMAMYQAKSAGRNTLRFFDPKMQAVVSARAALEAGLREAVQKMHFTLAFQPQVDSTCRVIGAEALLRWQPPESAEVSPRAFIPLAEETGLILPIGQWVLDTACERIASWANDHALAELTIAVNISARQFQQKDFGGQRAAQPSAAITPIPDDSRLDYRKHAGTRHGRRHRQAQALPGRCRASACRSITSAPLLLPR